MENTPFVRVGLFVLGFLFFFAAFKSDFQANPGVAYLVNFLWGFFIGIVLYLNSKKDKE